MPTGFKPRAIEYMKFIKEQSPLQGNKFVFPIMIEGLNNFIHKQSDEMENFVLDCKNVTSKVDPSIFQGPSGGMGEEEVKDDTNMGSSIPSGMGGMGDMGDMGGMGGMGDMGGMGGMGDSGSMNNANNQSSSNSGLGNNMGGGETGIMGGFENQSNLGGGIGDGNDQGGMGGSGGSQ